MTIELSKRQFVKGSATFAVSLAMPAIARGQGKTVIRWGDLMPATHPQAQMIERIAKDVMDKSAGRIEIQSFPAGQLGSGKDMIESVSAGNLTMTTDGGAALGQFLPQISLIEAPYLWRDAAHMAKALGSGILDDMNKTLIEKRGMRMVAPTYYGKRHITTKDKAVKSVDDMKGFKLRVPPVDTFKAMAEAWGAKPTPIAFPELYLALSQGAVDGQENPLPTIQSGKFQEVQKYLVLSGHIITPRLVIVNDAAWKGFAEADRSLLKAAIDAGAKWQDTELAGQEAKLVDTFKSVGMIVIEPDLESFRKPVLATVPKMFEEKWGKGQFEKLQAI
ncbi:MAG: sialic acid TRAP transporter substrate-binding protein SiaP [Hyphomicrobiaceae bacterium]